MIGLMLLGAGALYFGLMFFVMRWAWRAVRADGGSVLAASTFAFVGFLLVYLPVFWNHIPVLLAHRSMCAKDAGFKAYVTPEEWIAQNKEVIRQLTKQDVENQLRAAKTTNIADGFDQYQFFAGLLNSQNRGTYYRVLNINIRKWEQRIQDARTGQLLATLTNYSASGHRDDISGWKFPNKCPHLATQDPSGKYSEFISNLTKELQ